MDRYIERDTFKALNCFLVAFNIAYINAIEITGKRNNAQSKNNSIVIFTYDNLRFNIHIPRCLTLASRC